MVNIIVYLKKEHNAKKLVKYLLSKRLIASASIDENNVSYTLVNDHFSEVIQNVITAQSKALLFNSIVQAVEERTGPETLIVSMPIVAYNKVFDEIVRTKTIAI